MSEITSDAVGMAKAISLRENARENLVPNAVEVGRLVENVVKGFDLFFSWLKMKNGKLDSETVASKFSDLKKNYRMGEAMILQGKFEARMRNTHNEKGRESWRNLFQSDFLRSLATNKEIVEAFESGEEELKVVHEVQALAEFENRVFDSEKKRLKSEMQAEPTSDLVMEQVDVVLSEIATEQLLSYKPLGGKIHVERVAQLIEKYATNAT